MKIIFCDSNVVFGLLKRIVNGEHISHSKLFEYARNEEVIISDFVLTEIEKNFVIKYNLSLTKDHIRMFLQYSNISLMRSNILRSDALPYVNDLDDAQILQDAIDCGADYLVTKNIIDFDQEEIAKVFAIQVVVSLP